MGSRSRRQSSKDCCFAQPEVTDTAVTGRSADRAGEVPIAFVLLVQGATSSADVIRVFVNEQVARYKHLADVAVIDTIPSPPPARSSAVHSAKADG